jgi:excisionase family DNA binding protein
MPRKNVPTPAPPDRSSSDVSKTPILLTVAEACERLRVSEWMVNRLIWSRDLESIKIGRRRFIPVKAIDEFIERRRVEEAS